MLLNSVRCFQFSSCDRWYISINLLLSGSIIYLIMAFIFKSQNEKSGNTTETHFWQLQLFRRIAQLPKEDIMRQVVLKPGNLDSTDLKSPRWRGRPRQAGSNQVYNRPFRKVTWSSYGSRWNLTWWFWSWDSSLYLSAVHQTIKLLHNLTQHGPLASACIKLSSYPYEAAWKKTP